MTIACGGSPPPRTTVLRCWRHHVCYNSDGSAHPGVLPNDELNRKCFDSTLWALSVFKQTRGREADPCRIAFGFLRRFFHVASRPMSRRRSQRRSCPLESLFFRWSGFFLTKTAFYLRHFVFGLRRETFGLLSCSFSLRSSLRPGKTSLKKLGLWRLHSLAVCYNEFSKTYLYSFELDFRDTLFYKDDSINLLPQISNYFSNALPTTNSNTMSSSSSVILCFRGSWILSAPSVRYL